MKNQLLISENRILKGSLQMKAGAKKKAMNDAIELLSPFIEIKTAKQREAIVKDLRGFVIEFLRKRTSDFQAMMSDESLLQFFQIPDHVLRTIQAKLSSDKQLQWNDEYTDVIIPNVEEYATTPEQIERLEASQALIDAVNKIRSLGYNVHATQLALAVSNAVSSTGVDLRHNPQFIKSKRVR